jgi:hypothetical protein
MGIEWGYSEKCVAYSIYIPIIRNRDWVDSEKLPEDVNGEIFQEEKWKMSWFNSGKLDLYVILCPEVRGAIFWVN